MTDTPTIDPTTDAWGDYVRVVVNGERPTDVATDRGITGSTVSANVARIKRAIDAGATVPDGTTVPTARAMSFDAWVASNHGDDVSMAVDMASSTLATIDRDHARAVSARDDAIARITACDARRGTVSTLIGAVMPTDVSLESLRRDYDAYVATVATDAPDTGDDDDTGDDATA